MDKNRLIVASVIVLVLLIFGIVLSGIFYGEDDDSGNGIGEGFCKIDSDCVPKQVCHPTDCVLKGEDDYLAGDIYCTQECSPGTLDCGQGYCSCNQGNCEAVING